MYSFTAVFLHSRYLGHFCDYLCCILGHKRKLYCSHEELQNPLTISFMMGLSKITLKTARICSAGEFLMMWCMQLQKCIKSFGVGLQIEKNQIIIRVIQQDLFKIKFPIV